MSADIRVWSHKTAMQPPKSEICVLCGVRPATTRDHVPPKCFFRGLQIALNTVPACVECNNGASSDDEDLRFFVSAQVGKQAPGAASLWEDGALKSVMRKARLRQQVVSTAREVLIADSTGNVSPGVTVEVPARLYDSVFGRTTRGLYFLHSKRILDAHVAIKVVPLASPPDDALLSPLQYDEVGAGAFSYWFGVAVDDIMSSLWLYRFYGSHWVQATTGNANDA